MPEVLIRNKEGGTVGVLQGTTLSIPVDRFRYFDRSIGNRGAWGIEYEILFDQIPERSTIKMIDTQHALVFVSTNANWKDHGEVIRDGDPEVPTMVFLPVEYFTKQKL